MGAIGVGYLMNFTAIAHLHVGERAYAPGDVISGITDEHGLRLVRFGRAAVTGDGNLVGSGSFDGGTGGWVAEIGTIAAEQDEDGWHLLITPNTLDITFAEDLEGIEVDPESGGTIEWVESPPFPPAT